MPKYYCQTGNVKTIVDAVNPADAAKKVVARYLDLEETDMSFVMKIGETGFDFRHGSTMMSLIPVLRDLDIPLPDDEELFMMVCSSIGLNPDNVSVGIRNLLLYGNQEGDEYGFSGNL